MSMSFHVRDKGLFIYTFAVIALSSLCYYLFQAPTDPNRCNVLLHDGFWLNPSQLLNWQPAGCMLHTYKNTEASSCLQSRRLVFIGGDSALRLYEGVAKKFDPTYELPELSREAHLATTVGEDVRLEYSWDLTLDGSTFNEVRQGFDDVASRPSLTVITLERQFIQSEHNFTAIGQHVSSIVGDFRGNAGSQTRQSDDVVFVPVLKPNSEEESQSDTVSMMPGRIDVVNQALRNFASQDSVDVASAFLGVAEGPQAMVNGEYPSPKAAAVMADILLNLKCNTQLPKHYPYASTCCNGYPRPSWVQLLGFAFIAFMVPAAHFLYTRGHTPDSSTFLRFMPDRKHIIPILVMGGTVVLCYYCDRTNILGKEQKQTSPSQFFIGMALIIVASFYTFKSAEKDLPVLNRDQTDEWKGWMQVAILVYHYVGVSKTDYIYNYMRVCPTSYLFMTGFGHTVYFLKKDDFSFKRVVATMLRLNLLNVILAYAMGNDWLLYYFAPLVTWNFFVLFFCLWAGHKNNSNRKFLYGKMVVFALANTAIYRIPGILEILWSILQTCLRMQGDLREWRFRVTLDQYSMFPGMVCAVMFIDWAKYEFPKSDSWPRIQRIIYAVCIFIMLGYAVFEASEESKFVYNRKHTYVSWLPCCAFVILRNATPLLRRTHNGFFAWVGRGSLETFLLQFHIWLAADTAGLLVVGPPYLRFINFCITTVFFFWISSLVTIATSGVIEWIMGAEPKPQRPGLPTAQSHPANQPPVKPDVKAPIVTITEKEGEINSALPINGQVIDVKVDTASLEKGIAELKHSGLVSSVNTETMGKVIKDLRVRVAIILGAMAFMNWTYYW